jgi:hypothetical protein
MASDDKYPSLSERFAGTPFASKNALTIETLMPKFVFSGSDRQLAAS